MFSGHMPSADDLSKFRIKSGQVVVMDPGLMMPGTGLARDAGPVLRFLWPKVLPHIIIPVLRVLISPNVHLPKDSGTDLAWVAVDASQRTTSVVSYEGTLRDRYNQAWIAIMRHGRKTCGHGR
jgi:hypothetical protein